jgi:DNA-binding transcriptional ArsR family regulator
MKVLAEPRRLLILHLLMEGAWCNCELGKLFDMAPNMNSNFLSVLCQSGMVDAR